MHDDVISALYDAALGSDTWSSALPMLRRITGARRLMLKLSPPRAADEAQIYSDSPCGEADWATDGPATVYRQRYQYEDPVCYDRMVSGEVRQLEELIDRQAFTASSFYREHCKPIGIDHAFFGYLGRIDANDVWLSGSRGSDQGPFNPAEIASARELLPHLARAVLIQQRTARLEVQCAVFARSVSALSVGTILIDRQGNIIDTNEEARAILAAASPVSRIGNRLHLTGSAQHKFKSAVRRLAGSADAAPQTLEADDGCTCISLMIRRVEDVIGAKTRYPVSFIVYLKNREQPLPLGAVEYVMQAFGLSRAEARLTVLLAGGHTLEDSAVRLDVTLTTARTYCKRALVKTRTNRQAELVWLISNSLARLA